MAELGRDSELSSTRPTQNKIFFACLVTCPERLSRTYAAFYLDALNHSNMSYSAILFPAICAHKDVCDSEIQTIIMLLQPFQ